MTEKDRFIAWLFAGMVLTHVYVVTGTVTLCWWHVEEILSGRWTCDKDNKLTALLNDVTFLLGGYWLRGKADS